MPKAMLRVFQELNDFLPSPDRKKTMEVDFRPGDTVKNLVEARGIPHTEIDLITVNGESESLSYQIRPADRICVYPVFEAFDIGTLTRVRPEPLRETRFLLDVHLGKLVRYLRILGFDTVWEEPFEDEALARRAAEERRILLTRDRGLLMRKNVTHGYLVRSLDPDRQVAEVVRRFQLEDRLEPFTRCPHCNRKLDPLSNAQAGPLVPPVVRRRYRTFRRCPGCGRVFWRGAHWERMAAKLRRREDG